MFFFMGILLEMNNKIRLWLLVEVTKRLFSILEVIQHLIVTAKNEISRNIDEEKSEMIAMMQIKCDGIPANCILTPSTFPRISISNRVEWLIPITKKIRIIEFTEYTIYFITNTVLE